MLISNASFSNRIVTPHLKPVMGQASLMDQVIWSGPAPATPRKTLKCLAVSAGWYLVGATSVAIPAAIGAAVGGGKGVAIATALSAATGFGLARLNGPLPHPWGRPDVPFTIACGSLGLIASAAGALGGHVGAGVATGVMGLGLGYLLDSYFHNEDSGPAFCKPGHRTT